MSKSIDVNANKRGRPKTTGTGRLVGVRLLPDLLAAVDAFRAAQAGDLTRSETVRLLVGDALKSSGYLPAAAAEALRPDQLNSANDG